MKQLEIRLLGGFEVRLDGEAVSGFESQKSRGLLAYLALNPRTAVPREKLASLLWSERPDESARRNLRQALYNIRCALTPADTELQVFAADHQSIGFDPELDLWIDVDAFRHSISHGSTARGDDPRHLAAAVRLYRGDLLAGFFLRDCPGYDEWLLAEQEALRDEAVEALRTLIAAYLSRGEARFGIQYAKRLLAIDPLSEDAHRQLMRLYLVAGRRNSALAHYERLRNLLNDELGVEPLEETAELYRSILLEAHQREEEEKPAPIGPLIPLVARSSVFEQLGGSWNEVLEGSGRLTLIHGGRGLGKTRVARSFVDVVTSKRDVVVLRGRCFTPGPLVANRVFGEILSSAFADVLPDEVVTRKRLEKTTLERLVSLAPDTAPILQESLGLELETKQTDPARSRQALLEFFDVLGHGDGADARPILLLLDDLHAADAASLELLELLLPDLAERKVWVLATANLDDCDSRLLTGDEPEIEGGIVERVRLSTLQAANIRELADNLVGLEAADQLADFLWVRSDGLPLKVAELVNHLWDNEILTSPGPGQWRLLRDPANEIADTIELSELVRRRFERLPASARRLLALAAVIGQQFDVDTLRIAGDEHTSVVETCVELALERWLIRQHPRRWSQAGMQQDLVLWARGARRGYFEFAHRTTREAILGSINPLRRQIMHRDAARALAEHHAQNRDPVCESLAYHALEAGEPAEALPWLERAIERAARSGGTAVAETYRRRARQVIDSLLDSTDEPEERRRLEDRAAALAQD